MPPAYLERSGLADEHDDSSTTSSRKRRTLPFASRRQSAAVLEALLRAEIASPLCGLRADFATVRALLDAYAGATTGPDPRSRLDYYTPRPGSSSVPRGAQSSISGGGR